MTQIRPIVSWSFEPCKKSRAWRSKELMLACAKLSLLSIAKFYGRPIVYTDIAGQQILCKLTDVCDFDTSLEGCFNNVPLEFWAYPKLLAYSFQNAPYIHFDLDFIVHQKFSDMLLQCDVAFQNFEPINETRHTYITDADTCDLKLPEIFHKYKLDLISPPNVGFLLINDMAFNKKYCDAAIGMVHQNSDADFSKMGDRYRINCIVEQQLLGLMLRKGGVGYMPFMPPTTSPLNHHFDHYLGTLKNAWATQKNLEPHVDASVKAATAQLNQLLS